MKKYLKLTALVIIISTLLVTLNYCSKTKEEVITNENQTEYETLIEESKAMQEHILAFKTKMEYYRDNPGLKSNEKQYALDAIIDMESTLNLTYCYVYDTVGDIERMDTIIAIPVTQYDSIRCVDISERYFNAILDAVQEHFYINSTFTDKKLLAVDLEPVTTLDSVIVSTYIGNTQTLFFPEYDWVYGELFGTCDGQNYNGVSDAAKQSANYVRTIFYEEPPEGKRWGFTHIETSVKKPTDIVNGGYIYLNPDDDLPQDNSFDYLIYYASEEFGPVTPEILCLEASIELAFYKQSYVNLTQALINSSGGKKFYTCNYEGKDMITVWQHELSTQIGNRLIINDIVSELPSPD